MIRQLAWLTLSLLTFISTIAPARGDVLLTNYFLGSVERFNETTGAYLGTFIQPGAGGLTLAAGIAYNPADQLVYVSSRGTNQVLRYNLNGSFHSVFLNLNNFNPAGNPVPIPSVTTYSPGNLRFSPVNGDLYVSRDLNFYQFPTQTFGQGAVDRFDKTTGAYVNTPMVGFSGTTGLAFASNGDLYAASFSSGSGAGYVDRLPNGGSQSNVVAAGLGGLVAPTGITIGPNGSLYVVDTLGTVGAVHRYNVSGSTGTALADLISVSGNGGPNLGTAFPSDILFDSSGHVWLANIGPDYPPPPPANPLDGAHGSMYRYTTDGATATYLNTLVATGMWPSQFTVAPVPEPGTLALVASAAFGGLLMRRRRKK